MEFWEILTETHAQFWEESYKIYDQHYIPATGHVCSNEDEDNGVDGKMCTIGNHVVPYFPKIGLAQILAPQFIEKQNQKKNVPKK